MLKKVLYWLMMVIILIILNTSTIVWMVYNFLPSQQVPEVSMWDVSILKDQLNLTPSEYLSVPEKGSIYLFMIVGALSSAGFIKWLFVDTIQQVREKAKEKRNDINKFLKRDM